MTDRRRQPEADTPRPPARGVRARGGVEPLRLTSMLDVCFLLLIFFVLTASFSVGEQILPADLPRGIDRGTAVEEPELPLHIDLHSVGRDQVTIQLRGTGAAVGSVNELYRTIDGWRATPANPAGVYTAATPVIIRPDGTVSWGQVLNVYNAAVRARYENIHFAAADARR